MIIRKARKEDFEEFLEIKRIELKEYPVMVGRKTKIPPKNEIKKEFDRILKDKKEILLFMEEIKIEGYLHGTFYKNYWTSGGWIQDMFTLKEYRKKGIATKLIKDFTKLVKDRKLKEVSLNVYVKNKKASRLYEKLGFKTLHYTMKKRFK